MSSKSYSVIVIMLLILGCDNAPPLFNEGDMIKLKLDKRPAQIIDTSCVVGDASTETCDYKIRYLNPKTNEYAVMWVEEIEIIPPLDTIPTKEKKPWGIH